MFFFASIPHVFVAFLQFSLELSLKNISNNCVSLSLSLAAHDIGSYCNSFKGSTNIHIVKLTKENMNDLSEEMWWQKEAVEKHPVQKKPVQNQRNGRLKKGIFCDVRE